MKPGVGDVDWNEVLVPGDRRHGIPRRRTHHHRGPALLDRLQRRTFHDPGKTRRYCTHAHRMDTVKRVFHPTQRKQRTLRNWRESRDGRDGRDGNDVGLSAVAFRPCVCCVCYVRSCVHVRCVGCGRRKPRSEVRISDTKRTRSSNLAQG